MESLNKKEMHHIIGGVFSGTDDGLQENKDNINTEIRCGCTYLDVTSLTNSNKAIQCKCLCISEDNL